MPETTWYDREAKKTLERLAPRLENTLADHIQADQPAWQLFSRRLRQHFPRLFRLYYDLYHSQYDFFYTLEDLMERIGRTWFRRPADLRRLDGEREQNPGWYLSNQMLGGVCYVDLFAGDLKAIIARLPYFQELGLTYLHLMPLFKVPHGENDGGYAVSSYREVEPRLGTMEQLVELGGALRAAGISLVVDLVFNHTSDEHTWARQAFAGDPQAQEFYRLFPDRSLPDAYERNLREIFPDEHPGAFTYQPEMARWVWTTFHSYQWDLNYANPLVFNHMADEMLFLANQGVEVLRLDAVAFTWKEMGSSCENLPGAHTLIQAFNAVARIAAPALFFKSEAIVHPDEVIKYIHLDECQLSYNPLLMALLWNSLATRKVRLLRQALAERFGLPEGCAWVNYVRCHDDIGWTFSDEDAARLGVSGYDHRQFLNRFYTGRFEGSFARGLPFQENPKTGDCRISGSCASLAGLEKALQEEGPAEVELAIRRILLLHGVMMTVGGLPLIYLGDEVGQLNDYTYRSDPAKANDSRWVHRPAANWEVYERRHIPGTLEERVYSGIQHLIQLRKTHRAFSGQEPQVLDSGNEHILAYARGQAKERLVVYANFSEQQQTIPKNQLRICGLGAVNEDLLSNKTITVEDLLLEPYQLIFLTER